MGDPNGLCWYDGEYHLFYLHFWKWPRETEPGSWAHVVSEDMIRWRQVPTAISAGEFYDSRACWSGCFRIIEGVPTIFYSGVSENGVNACLATSKNMIDWIKAEDNPLMDPGQLRGGWDHCVWKEGDSYLMATGGREGVQLFESNDLRCWMYLHPLFAEDPKRGLSKWDCPHLFQLGCKHVLIAYAHPMRRNIYFTGRYENRRFHVEEQGNLDAGLNAGGAFFAAHPSYEDPRGRLIILGALQDLFSERHPSLGSNRMWSNAMSLPRVVTLSGDGRLRFDPAQEIESLRGCHWRFDKISLTADRPYHLPGVEGECLEIIVEIDVGTAEQCRLDVRCNPDGTEKTSVVYDAVKKTIALNGASDSLVLADREPLKLRVFVDRSMVEVFANRCVCLSAWTYRGRSERLHVELHVTGGTGTAYAVDVWQVNAAFCGQR